MTRGTAHLPRPRRTRGRIAPVAAIVVGVALLGTGTSYGYFSGTNAVGHAAGTIGNAPTAVTATTDTVGTLLYPSGPAGDLAITIVNSGTVAYRVTGIAIDPSRTILSDKVGCSGAGTGISLGTSTSPEIVVPANGSTTARRNGVVSMSNGADNVCQGATFTIPVTLTGRTS